MIRDITIGQYYGTDSVIHKLDPRVKLLATFVFIISLFIKRSVITYSGATLFLVIVIILSKVPVRYILKGLKPVLLLLLFTCVMSLLFTRTGTVLIDKKPLIITTEGIKNALFLGIRLAELVIGSSILTYTTKPAELTDGIERGFKFLNAFKVPVHEFAVMMSIALRFIPILTEELDRIMKAQEARCATFNEGNVIKRAKAMAPILIPLLVAAIKRANDLALAMEARCYRGGEGRTKLYPLKYAGRDVVGYMVLLIYFAGMIGLRIVIGKLKIGI